jgi:hypothetical protein
MNVPRTSSAWNPVEMVDKAFVKQYIVEHNRTSGPRTKPGHTGSLFIQKHSLIAPQALTGNIHKAQQVTHEAKF